MEEEFTLKNIDGVSASIGAPPITHVMYADDIVLFSKAIRSNPTTIMNFIQKYCNWLGQSLIKSKSGVLFSKQSPLAQSQIGHVGITNEKPKEGCHLPGISSLFD